MMKPLTTWFACTLIITSAHALHAEEDSPATVAAKERQTRFHSITFDYRMKEVSESGAVSIVGHYASPDAKNFPERRRTFESVNRLVFDGDRIRHEDNHPTPDERTMNWNETTTLTVSDGNAVKKLHYPSSGATRQNAVAKISTPKKVSVADLAMFMPFHLCCRGVENLSCRNAFTFPTFRPSGLRLKFGGSVLEEYNNPSYPSAQLWVDPSQGYTLRRVRYQKDDGKTASQTDVRSERHSETGMWMPVNWTHTIFDEQGKVSRTFDITVFKVTVNSAAADSDFDLKFPAGLQVYDQRNGSWSLVRDDGSLLPIAGASVSSESVRSDLESTWWKRNWWWVGLSTLAGTFAICVLIRKTRARRRTPTSPPSSAEPPSASLP